MEIKPTPVEAARRLRLDGTLDGDLDSAIEQAHAAAITYLDGKLYPDAAALAAVGDPRGIVCTPDIIAAQLLLVDVLVGSNTVQDGERKSAAAYNMLRLHRNMGV